ncbi:hypothetical protein GJ496_005160 [Pomphorhynchus laevis]|nr:hypothetical protein GJ496_005160 [Pomphorhynchus laevis]
MHSKSAYVSNRTVKRYGVTLLFTRSLIECTRMMNSIPSIETITVNERQPVGSFVVNIRYLLPIVSMAHSYGIIDDEVSKYFRLCNISLNLYIKERLDHRKLCVVDKICKCEKCILHLSLALSLKSKITVEVFRFIVVDIDDHHPFFPSSSVTVNVEENQLSSRRYILPVAEDNDFMDSQNLTYHLNFTNSSLSSLFKLYQFGNELSLEINSPLDREQQSQYQLWLTASGRELSTTIEVLVIVDDLNDNAPICLDNTFTVSTTFAGNLGRLHASDDDAMMNSQLSFSKLDLKNSQFYEIDTDGNIRLTISIPDERSIKIPFIVQDNGSPDKLSSECFADIIPIKSPVFALNTVSNEVILVKTHEHKSSMYISNLIRKGQQLLDIDMWLPSSGINTKWRVECSERAFDLKQISRNRFTLNLLVNLKELQRERHNSQFTISCYDEHNPKVRYDYTIMCFIILQSIYRIQYPLNNSKIEIKSIEQITIGPAFSLELMHTERQSLEIEPVFYLMNYEDDDILMHIDNDRDIYIDYVWVFGQFKFQINLIGNISGYVYQKLYANVHISEQIYKSFVNSQRSMPRPYLKRRRTSEKRHKNILNLIKDNPITEFFIILTIVLIILLISFVCLKYKTIIDKCIMIKRMTQSKRPFKRDFYVANVSIL